ncbi:MAG TPA: ATP-binding protein [Candidatus Limnocylindria bacterium]
MTDERPAAAGSDLAAAFEALVERAGDHLVLLADDRLRIARAGPALARLAGRPPASLVGMSLIAALGSARLDAVAREAIASGSPATGEADLGRGGERRFEVDAVPLPGWLVISLHDVTTLRRMERIRRDFVANVSHELRTPLTSIKLLAETLSAGAADAETAAEFAAQIEREIDQLSQLVNELLELSLIESGAVALRLEPLDPDAVVADAATRIGPVAERREIRVRVLERAADASVRALADAGRLSQALVNLAHNAVKYSDPGSEVRMGWEEHGDAVRFLVADEGIGIPEAQQERIFERFYKVDRARAREHDEPEGRSAGLGLAIVKHLAEAHHGSVGVTSTEGVGSTFWIEVPRG